MYLGNKRKICYNKWDWTYGKQIISIKEESEMDTYGFYTGRIFDAYEYLGAHADENGTMFRVFAPNAKGVSIIGDFNGWQDTSMNDIIDGNFYEKYVEGATPGMKYKFKVYGCDGSVVDHTDPFGYQTELRPASASIITDTATYKFDDDRWMNKRTSGKNKPVNIYEVHLGSWKTNSEDENGWYSYRELAIPLLKYVKKHGYNYIEIMPICEYPCDESWGYQAIGFFSPTSRYGSADDLKYMVDIFHRNGVGVILDFAPVHFAVNADGLANFDGSALYEYPNSDVGYNQWGSKNFMHSRGEVRSYLQSSVRYWLKEFHMDGIRFDAISNIIYWQGDTNRGVNGGAVEFIKYMNEGIKKEFPDVMMIAEDSTSYKDVTRPVNEGGLGFDYKWDLGWMNDTLDYMKLAPYERSNNYHKLTFSMMYFYHDSFLLPLSHDEVVHGKATILQKMNGDYEDKWPQARAFYMYMFAHPGKKLNFMGNEIGQFREWDEKRELDYMLLDYPIHKQFEEFMTDLNKLYLASEALYAKDYDENGFAWMDCESVENCTYGFVRKGENEDILCILNFENKDIPGYDKALDGYKSAKLVMNSNWKKYGGDKDVRSVEIDLTESRFRMRLDKMSAYYFILEKK